MQKAPLLAGPFQSGDSLPIPFFWRRLNRARETGKLSQHYALGAKVTAPQAKLEFYCRDLFIRQAKACQQRIPARIGVQAL